MVNARAESQEKRKLRMMRSGEKFCIKRPALRPSKRLASSPRTVFGLKMGWPLRADWLSAADLRHRQRSQVRQLLRGVLSTLTIVAVLLECLQTVAGSSTLGQQDQPFQTAVEEPAWKQLQNLDSLILLKENRLASSKQVQDYDNSEDNKNKTDLIELASDGEKTPTQSDVFDLSGLFGEQKTVSTIGTNEGGPDTAEFQALDKPLIVSIKTLCQHHPKQCTWEEQIKYSECLVFALASGRSRVICLPFQLDLDKSIDQQSSAQAAYLKALSSGQMNASSPAASAARPPGGRVSNGAPNGNGYGNLNGKGRERGRQTDVNNLQAPSRWELYGPLVELADVHQGGQLTGAPQLGEPEQSKEEEQEETRTRTRPKTEAEGPGGAVEQLIELLANDRVHKGPASGWRKQKRHQQAPDDLLALATLSELDDGQEAEWPSGAADSAGDGDSPWLPAGASEQDGRELDRGGGGRPSGGAPAAERQRSERRAWRRESAQAALQPAELGPSWAQRAQLHQAARRSKTYRVSVQEAERFLRNAHRHRRLRALHEPEVGGQQRPLEHQRQAQAQGRPAGPVLGAHELGLDGGGPLDRLARLIPFLSGWSPARGEPIAAAAGQPPQEPLPAGKQVAGWPAVGVNSVRLHRSDETVSSKLAELLPVLNPSIPRPSGGPDDPTATTIMHTVVTGLESVPGGLGLSAASAPTDEPESVSGLTALSAVEQPEAQRQHFRAPNRARGGDSADSADSAQAEPKDRAAGNQGADFRDSPMECNMRNFTFRATKSDEASGHKCWGDITASICYGGCDSGEIADWLFPHKKSIHRVCRHGGRIRRKAILLECTSPDVHHSLREYHYVDARDCVCRKCTSLDTTCLGTMTRPYLQTLSEAALAVALKGD